MVERRLDEGFPDSLTENSIGSFCGSISGLVRYVGNSPRFSRKRTPYSPRLVIRMVFKIINTCVEFIPTVVSLTVF